MNGITDMVHTVSGNILTSKAEAIVNTVNTVGVMGKGIALQFKKAFPDNYEAYAAACKKGEVVPGKVFVTKTFWMGSVKYVINFPTKRHWKGKSRLEDIENGLADLVEFVRENKIKSIAIPPLGCGLGGLSWQVVSKIIRKSFENLDDVEVFLYAPAGAPAADKIINNTEKPRMTVGRAAFLTILSKYMHSALEPTVTVIEAQKLCYFLQVSGEQLRLNYKKSFYGPYADNLRHVMSQIDGHYISGWGDGQGKPLSELKLICSINNLQNSEETNSRIRRVLELVDGFESPYDLELLATVHWVVENELDSNSVTVESIKQKISQWTDRKNKIFKECNIKLAWERLHEFRFV